MDKLFANRMFVFIGVFIVMSAFEVLLMAHHEALGELSKIGSVLYLVFLAAVSSVGLTYYCRR